MAIRTQVPVSNPQQTDTLVSTVTPRRSLQAESESELLQSSPDNTQIPGASTLRENFSRVPVGSGAMPFVQPKLVVGKPNDKDKEL